MELTKKVVGGTLGALSLAFDAVRHVAWFVSYHVDRTVRDADDGDAP